MCPPARTYPYIYGKVCLQSGAKRADGQPLYPNLTTFFTTVLKSDGILGRWPAPGRSPRAFFCRLKFISSAGPTSSSQGPNHRFI